MTLAGASLPSCMKPAANVYLYLHGKNGCKEEAERFAATACEAGWQVLAIDLPEHGARKNSHERLLPWVAVPEIEAVYARMKPVWAHIRLYGVSIGAWLAMQALQGDAPEQTLLGLSGGGYGSSHREYDAICPCDRGTAAAGRGDPHGSWGDPLMAVSVLGAEKSPHWHGRTQVLYGDRDALTSRTMIERFRQEVGASDDHGRRGTLVRHPSADGGLQTWEEANV